MFREAEPNTQTPDRFQGLSALVLSADCFPWCQGWQEEDSDKMPYTYQNPGDLGIPNRKDRTPWGKAALAYRYSVSATCKLGYAHSAACMS